MLYENYTSVKLEKKLFKIPSLSDTQVPSTSETALRGIVCPLASGHMLWYSMLNFREGVPVSALKYRGCSLFITIQSSYRQGRNIPLLEKGHHLFMFVVNSYPQ